MHTFRKQSDDCYVVGLFTAWTNGQEYFSPMFDVKTFQQAASAVNYLNGGAAAIVGAQSIILNIKKEYT